MTDTQDQIISESLHGSAIATFWCGTSFLLASTVFQPTFASLSYILGRKPLLLVALVFFTVGAIVGALAQNLTSLLIGRSIQGVGGGGIISLTEILITDLVPLRERGKWFGFQSLTWAIGYVNPDEQTFSIVLYSEWYGINSRTHGHIDQDYFQDST